ncbi:MAG: hypothetical protein JSW51_11565 [Gemmatimonadota bacterium]|nr:MAG: hypothetical protein JSW51_11565 [Gemmatimonadota bacterium]
MFDEKISRRSFLTGGAKVAAALFCAPAIIQADRLMKVAMPPEPKIITDPNAFNFTMQGLVRGSRVYVADDITGQVYINETVDSETMRWNLPEGEGRPIIARIRKQGYLPQEHRMGLPYPDAKNKLVVQMPRDVIYG